MLQKTEEVSATKNGNTVNFCEHIYCEQGGVKEVKFVVKYGVKVIVDADACVF